MMATFSPGHADHQVRLKNLNLVISSNITFIKSINLLLWVTGAGRIIPIVLPTLNAYTLDETKCDLFT